MKLSDVKVGTTVDIYLFDRFDKQISPNYLSKIQQVNDKNKTVDIDMPVVDGRIIYFDIENLIHLQITAEDGIYSLNGKIAGIGEIGIIPVMNIVVESSINKMQRREYFRFKMTSEVKYRSFNPDKTDPNEESFQSATLINISGGGIGILSLERLEKTGLFECIFDLKSNLQVIVTARVVSVLLNENNKGWRIGMKFENISERERENIINFILSEQLRLRRQGLMS